MDVRTTRALAELDEQIARNPQHVTCDKYTVQDGDTFAPYGTRCTTCGHSPVDHSPVAEHSLFRRCTSRYSAQVRCEDFAGHDGQHAHSFFARYW